MGVEFTMKDYFYNRTALVTGASRGLGLYIAKILWSKGANLILVARSDNPLQQIRTEFLIQQMHPAQTIEVIAADFFQQQAVEKLIDRLTQLKIDIVINNAAVQGPIGPLWENDWQAWQQTLQVNLLVPIALCRALVSQMILRRDGKMINLSGGGATSPRAHFSAYAVAKAALVRFSETLAEEVKSFNICVNCIAPGMMNTELINQIMEAGAEKAGEKEYHQAIKNRTSDDSVIHRAAELCVLLASEKGNSITGKLISAVWDPWKNFPNYLNELISSDIYTLRRIVPKDRGQNWGDVE
jgi:NAD(P)-dependent dehydrogenase (short-subunit alcohol dehydrogenase family)